MRPLVRLIRLTGVFVVGMLLTASPSAADQQTVFTVAMSGDQLVRSPYGDPDGVGTATITIDHKAQRACVDVDTTNINPPIEGVALQEGAAGEEPTRGWGSWDVPFSFDDADPSSCQFSFRDITTFKQLWRLVEDDPARFHLVVRNWDYPDDGAIRGQLALHAK